MCATHARVQSMTTAKAAIHTTVVRGRWDWGFLLHWEQHPSFPPGPAWPGAIRLVPPTPDSPSPPSSQPGLLAGPLQGRGHHGGGALPPPCLHLPRCSHGSFPHLLQVHLPSSDEPLPHHPAQTHTPPPTASFSPQDGHSCPLPPSRAFSLGHQL